MGPSRARSGANGGRIRWRSLGPREQICSGSVWFPNRSAPLHYLKKKKKTKKVNKNGWTRKNSCSLAFSDSMKVYKRRVSPLGFPVCLSGRENEWIWGKWLRCPWFWWPDLYSRIFCFYGWLSFLREGDFKRERTSERAEGSVAATLSFFLCFKSEEKEKKNIELKMRLGCTAVVGFFFIITI